MIRKYFFCFCFTRDAKKKSDFDAFYEKKVIVGLLAAVAVLMSLSSNGLGSILESSGLD